MNRLKRKQKSTALAYSQARTIKRAYLTGKIERRRLAEIYGVSDSTMYNILRGKFDDGKGAHVI